MRNIQLSLAEAQSVRRAGCDHRVALGAAFEDELKIQRSDFGREGDVPLCLPKLMESGALRCAGLMLVIFATSFNDALA